MRKCDLRFLIIPLVLVFVSACGGGGGNDSSSPSINTSTYPLKNAWINYLSDTRSYAFSTSNAATPVTVSGVVSQFPLKTARFENAVVLMKYTVSNGVIRINGKNSPFGESDALYVDSNYNPVGLVEDSDDNPDNGVEQYSIVSGPVNIPATVKVGDSGILFTADRYSSSNKLVRLGKKTMSFNIDPETANTAILRLSEFDYGLNDTVEATVISVFRISLSGDLTRISELDYVDDVPVLVEFQGL